MNAATVLQRPTLVLNRHWAPIRTTSVREAICLVAKGSARIVEPETYAVHDLRTWADVSAARAIAEGACVRSPRVRIAAPEVIVLTVYDGRAERSVVFSRRNLFKRDRHTCQYCGAQPGPEELTIDHVLPRSKGGQSAWANCVLACVDCNRRKADRTPEQAGMTLRRRPVKPTWRTLAQVSPRERRESWEKFLARAYWEVELEP